MTTETTKLRADVPVDMHPDALLVVGRPLDAKDTVGPRALAAGREAMSAMYSVYGAMNDAEKALQAAAEPARRQQQPQDATDPRRMFGLSSRYEGDVRMHNGRPRRSHGRENEYADAATEAVERTTLTVDRRVKELEGYRKTLEERVSAALDNPARKTPEGLALATEVRAHVKALSGDKRWSFLKEAVDAGDRATVAAVLAAPPYLSGLTARQHDTTRELAARKFAPVDHDQLAATEAVIERVKTVSQSFLGRYAKALELRNTPRAKADDGLAKLREAR